MSEERISRRGLVPALAVTAGAAVALSQVDAQAAQNLRGQSTAGPCGLWRGHSLLFQFFLPAVQRGLPRANRYRLTLVLEDGTQLVTKDFELMPGKGVQFLLEHQEDGTLVFDGAELPPQPQQLVVIAIIAILIGLLLPAVQKVRATSTSFVPGVTAGQQNVDYLLPFVEQDN